MNQVCTLCGRLDLGDHPRCPAFADYNAGRWCGECKWGVVEDPPCCTQPDSSSTGSES